MLELILGSHWIGPMTRMNILQAKSVKNLLTDTPSTNIKFIVILAIIICEILHPTTVQRAFPFLVVKFCYLVLVEQVSSLSSFVFSTSSSDNNKHPYYE